MSTDDPDIPDNRGPSLILISVDIIPDIPAITDSKEDLICPGSIAVRVGEFALGSLPGFVVPP
jgi:hypothetical protein